MSFQSTVFFNQGSGVPGEFYNDSPVRSQSLILDSSDATNNIFGRAFTIVSQGVAQAGNPAETAVFAGYMCDPKQAASFGTVGGGPLAPTLTLPNNVNSDFLTMGSIWVTLPAAANIGDLVIYSNADGSLATIAPTDPLTEDYSPGYAVVDFYTVPTGGGLAVITVTNIPTVPAFT